MEVDCREAAVLEAYARFVTGKGTKSDMQLLNTVRGLDGSMTSTGYADTLKSLDTIRQVFFNKSQSQGEAQLPKYGNVMRVQVYGAPELRAVRINVDTATPWVFSFAPLYVE